MIRPVLRARLEQIMIEREWWGFKKQSNYRSTMDYILLEHGISLEEDPDIVEMWEEKIQVWLAFLLCDHGLTEIRHSVTELHSLRELVGRI